MSVGPLAALARGRLVVSRRSRPGSAIAVTPSLPFPTHHTCLFPLRPAPVPDPTAPVIGFFADSIR